MAGTVIRAGKSSPSQPVPRALRVRSSRRKTRLQSIVVPTQNEILQHLYYHYAKRSGVNPNNSQVYTTQLYQFL